MSFSHNGNEPTVTVFAMRVEDHSYSMTPMDLAHVGIGTDGSFAALLALTRDYLDYVDRHGRRQEVEQMLERAITRHQVGEREASSGVTKARINSLRRLMQGWSFLREVLDREDVDRLETVEGSPLEFFIPRSAPKTLEYAIPEFLSDQGPFTFSAHEVKMHH